MRLPYLDPSRHKIAAIDVGNKFDDRKELGKNDGIARFMLKLWRIGHEVIAIPQPVCSLPLDKASLFVDY
jgi:hypothetical protein